MSCRPLEANVVGNRISRIFIALALYLILTSGTLMPSWTGNPVQLHAQVYDIARYGIDFIGDRMVIQIDRDWTQPAAIHFTVPGKWRSPDGPPAWAAVLAADGSEHATPDGPIASAREPVSAAELAFPASDRSLCFQFLPPQRVEFTAAGMAFTVDSTAGEKWTLGFCPKNNLRDWRWGE